MEPTVRVVDAVEHEVEPLLSCAIASAGAVYELGNDRGDARADDLFGMRQAGHVLLPGEPASVQVSDISFRCVAKRVQEITRCAVESLRAGPLEWLVIVGTQEDRNVLYIIAS